MAINRRTQINIVSLIAALFILILLLFFSSSFSWIKIFVLVSLMLAFLSVVYRNAKLTMREKVGYANYPASYPQRREQKPFSGLNEFFQKISERGLNKSSNDYCRMERTYTQEINSNSRFRNTTNQHKTNSSLSQYEQEQHRKRQFNILIPQNITQIVQEFKQIINPQSYYHRFNKEYITLRQKIEKNNRYHNKNEVLAPLESYCFLGQTLQTKLSKDQDLVINDILLSVENVADFLKDKIDNLIRNSNYSFKTVSESTFKCFGLTVNFGFKNKMNTKSKEVTLKEIKEFLQLYRIQKHFSPHTQLKLIIMPNEFTTTYFQRLTNATNHVSRLLEHIENPLVMTLKIYINILNDTFPDSKIHLGINRSLISVGVRNLKHEFCVHQRSSDFAFTYNNIKGFQTKNPLLAVLAFLADINKRGEYQRHELVRNLDRGFRYKPKNS